ncbi:hypothetical protein ACS0TY_012831 [Phlomoides rotata]
MGLLDQLWDETLAGPTPDSGLGKLRKHNSFSSKSSAAPPPVVVSLPLDDTRITRLRNNIPRNLTVSVDSAPPSPSGSTTPSSPFSPTTPGGNFKKLTRRKSTSAVVQKSESKTPTGYDWIVLSSLER